MWSSPEDVELAQRGGTGPKNNHTFSAEMEQPKEVEPAQRGGTEERSAILGYFPLEGWRIVSSWDQANCFLLGPGT